MSKKKPVNTPGPSGVIQSVKMVLRCVLCGHKSTISGTDISAGKWPHGPMCPKCIGIMALKSITTKQKWVADRKPDKKVDRKG